MSFVDIGGIVYPHYLNFLFIMICVIYKYSQTCLKAPCPPSHLGIWLCEGGGHGSEAAVSG